MNLYAAFPLLSSVFLFAGSFYLFKKRSAVFFYKLLGVNFILFFFIELSNFMVLTASSVLNALFWQRCSLGGWVFVPFCWILVSFALGRETGRSIIKKGKWYMAILIACTIGFLVILAKGLLIKDAGAFYGGYSFVLTPAGRNFFVFLLLSLVIILRNFENIYRLSEREQKAKLKYFIRGIGLFLAVYIVLSSLAVLFSRIDIRFSIVGSTVLVSGVLLVLHAIKKYGFTPVPIFIGRQVIYTSVTVSIVGIYLVAVGLVVKLFMIFGFNLASFFSFMAAFFVFFLLVLFVFSSSFKKRLRVFVDRGFYKDQYDYRREWADVGERLGTILNIDELISEVQKIVKEIMQVDAVEVVLRDVEKVYHLQPNPELMEWLLRCGEPVSVEDFQQKQPQLFEENKQFLDKLGAQIIVSLNVKRKILGILTVGTKAGRKNYSSESMEMLKTIGRQFSIAILNVQLSEELIVSQEMEHFHKLSSFLIHDLKNCVSMLSMVMQNAARNFDNPEFQKDALSTLSDTIVRMNSLMHKLSTVPQALELNLKECDVNTLIEKTISKLKIEDRTPIKLFRFFGNLPLLKIDSEYIQKVILNLFMNAIEAMPDGGNLIVRTELEEWSGFFKRSCVQIEVNDSGCGISAEFMQRSLFKPFQSSKRKGIGIGLFQCKTIVEAHGGRILVESEVGKGTAFKVQLPLSAADSL